MATIDVAVGVTYRDKSQAIHARPRTADKREPAVRLRSISSQRRYIRMKADRLARLLATFSDATKATP